MDLNEPRMQALCEDLVQFRSWTEELRKQLQDNDAKQLTLHIGSFKVQEVHIEYTREEILLCFAHVAVMGADAWST